MSWYEKKILYLAYDNGEEKGQNAGFAEFRKQKDELILRLQIKGTSAGNSEEMKIWVLTERRDIDAGIMSCRQEPGKAEKSFAIKGDKLLIGKEEVSEEELAGIRISYGGDRRIFGYLRRNRCECDRKESGRQRRQVPEYQLEDAQLHQSELSLQQREEGSPHAVCEVLTDKWGELQRQYPVIHPFGDDRIFVRIELKDFVIFQSSCQKLVNNSFLLHGFYNYRYLILGPDRELGGNGDSRFYLGVPGTYFEREKTVAVMFGFEGFECEGPVETGKFGYYMRRVEL